MLSSLRWPVGLGFVLVLPFVILELVNRRGSEFPVALFLVMWGLSATFVAALRHERPAGAKPYRAVLQVAVLVVVAAAWGSLVLDQMPCFLGVPNCD